MTGCPPGGRRVSHHEVDGRPAAEQHEPALGPEPSASSSTRSASSAYVSVSSEQGQQAPGARPTGARRGLEVEVTSCRPRSKARAEPRSWTVIRVPIGASAALHAGGEDLAGALVDEPDHRVVAVERDRGDDRVAVGSGRTMTCSGRMKTSAASAVDLVGEQRPRRRCTPRWWSRRAGEPSAASRRRRTTPRTGWPAARRPCWVCPPGSAGRGP